ncbi:MAG: hypothetical protein GY737_16695 [Desulfobacteraceae bacterium]|nr:hypothetical protein [Desulfobacteraceae bacterium]
MEKFKHLMLRNFKESELIFNDQQTKEILKFFFSTEHQYIEGLVINHKIKSYAQGLLIEAVDATYAIGFIEIVHKTFNLQPPVKLKKIFIKFGQRAASHWFKHAKRTDLSNIKIYNIVRVIIDIRFRQQLHELADEIVMNKPTVIVLAYNNPLNDKTIWG